MAIKNIIVRGYGSFSDVNELPTRGYSIGAVIALLSLDNAVFAGFRDKRLFATFRDKRLYAEFRDKRAA